MSSVLFSPLTVGGLELKNRLVFLPLYLAYPDEDNEVNELVLDHYDEMADSGVGLVVVENAAVEPAGLGLPRTMLVSDDRFVPGLARLAERIRARGARTVLQINHSGRYAHHPDRIAPSAVPVWGQTPKAMDESDMERVRTAFAQAARRVKDAGFDMVEIHGGTGYLLPQFLSPRTNLRTDGYGGDPERRRRFPLEVMDAVREAVGRDYPVGYRFLADEYMPGGLRVPEALPYARELARRGVAYLSVMIGCYESFQSPPYTDEERSEAFMACHARAVKEVTPGVPVVAAGRMQTPELAEAVLWNGQADLIGLARVLFADPLWPRKARGEVAAPIVPCEATCSLCLKRIMGRKPAFCSRWRKERRERFLARVGEAPEATAERA